MDFGVSGPVRNFIFENTTEMLISTPPLKSHFLEFESQFPWGTYFRSFSEIPILPDFMGYLFSKISPRLRRDLLYQFPA